MDPQVKVARCTEVPDMHTGCTGKGDSVEEGHGWSLSTIHRLLVTPNSQTRLFSSFLLLPRVEMDGWRSRCLLFLEDEGHTTEVMEQKAGVGLGPQHPCGATITRLPAFLQTSLIWKGNQHPSWLSCCYLEISISCR